MSHHSKKKVPRKRSVKKQKKLSKSTRKWSLKYKRSINCNKPRGFSQKQYCKKKSRRKSKKKSVRKSKKKSVRKSRKRSPRRYVKKSRRRTAAAEDDNGSQGAEEVNVDNVTLAAQALVAIAGVNPDETVRGNDYLLKNNKFLSILAKFVKIYDSTYDGNPADQYLYHPLPGEREGYYPKASLDSLIHSAISGVEVDDAYIDTLKNRKYMEKMNTYEPGSLTNEMVEKYLEMALKSAIYEYNDLRPIPAKPSQHLKISNMLRQYALPKLISIIESLPVMDQLKKLYFNMKAVNKELAGILLIFIKFYKDVVITLVKNIKPIAKSITNFSKACLIVIAPLVALPKIISAIGVFRVLNGQLFLEMIAEIMTQINTGISNLPDRLRVVRERLETESNNATARMESRLVRTGQTIEGAATTVSGILPNATGRVLQLTETAATNPAFQNTLGPLTMTAATNTARRVNSGVTRYVGNASTALGISKPVDEDEDEGDAISQMMGVTNTGDASSGGAEEDESDSDSDAELEKELFGRNFDDDTETKSDESDSSESMEQYFDEATKELEKPKFDLGKNSAQQRGDANKSKSQNRRSGADRVVEKKGADTTVPRAPKQRRTTVPPPPKQRPPRLRKPAGKSS